MNRREFFRKAAVGAVALPITIAIGWDGKEKPQSKLPDLKHMQPVPLEGQIRYVHVPMTIYQMPSHTHTILPNPYNSYTGAGVQVQIYTQGQWRQLVA